MADKLGNLQLGHGNQPKSQAHMDAPLQASVSSTVHLLASTSASSLGHRASVSTSISEWSKTTATTAESSDALLSMDIDQPLVQAQARRRTKPKGTYRLTDFIIQRTLGCGSFGRVHLVRSKHNLRFYAIKVINKQHVVRQKQVEHTNNELHMLETVQHPFIINLWGSFQDSSNLYMVMDFVPGGELFTLLRRSNRFPDPVAKFYAAEVALALNHLHSLDIIYRDLKPENILLSADGHIKIADFGFAKECQINTYTLCGTPDYLAPEIVSKKRYNKSVDWYALGILIYEMLYGLPPFHEQPTMESGTPGHEGEKNQKPHIVRLYDRILQGPSAVRWPPFQPHATDLILKLLEKDPSKRYGNMRDGAGDVFGHPWFREVDWVKLLNRQVMAPYMPRITGEGDASQFEKWPESDELTRLYGQPAADPYGWQFPGFDYTM